MLVLKSNLPDQRGGFLKDLNGSECHVRSSFAPQSEAAFVRFPPGTKHQLHTENGTFLVDGEAMTPVR